MTSTPLQKELGKRRPFELPEQEAALNLERTRDCFSREFAELFKRHGLSSPQYNVLRILRGHGGEGTPCQRIGSEMVTYDPDVTRLVDRLAAAGMVKRRRAGSDRRVVYVQITKMGLDALQALDEPVLELHRRQLGHLTRSELGELNRLLVKARERPS